MDQGSIQAVKLKAHILTQIEMSTKCGLELLKDVSVLSAF